MFRIEAGGRRVQLGKSSRSPKRASSPGKLRSGSRDGASSIYCISWPALLFWFIGSVADATSVFDKEFAERRNSLPWRRDSQALAHGVSFATLLLPAASGPPSLTTSPVHQISRNFAESSTHAATAIRMPAGT